MPLVEAGCQAPHHLPGSGNKERVWADVLALTARDQEFAHVPSAGNQSEQGLGGRV